MSKVFVVFALCAIIAASVVRAESESESEDLEDAEEMEFPAGKVRAGKPLKAARVPHSGRFGYTQKVVIVPKGDPRAQAPYVAPPTPVAPAEPRVIVEAEVFETPDPAVATAPVPSIPVVAPGAVLQAGPIPTATRVLKAGAPNAGSCLSGYRGATVAAKAAAYQAEYKRRGVKYSQPSRQFGISAKFADCSSFVTSILADTGYNCLFAAGRYTAYMNGEIRKRGGYKQTAAPGDIVMWGSHTGLITASCGGGKYTMVAMGNSGAGLASCKTVAQLKGWGSGGWLGFWTPRP